MAPVSLLMPFEPAEISPLPVTWVAVGLVIALFMGPFGDGDAFVTVDVVGLLMGEVFLAAVALVVRAVVVNVDADVGRLDVIVVVVVVEEMPPAVVRVVLVFVRTLDAGLC